MRNVIHVIEAIYEIISKNKEEISNSEKKNILEDMDRLLGKMVYSAPEQLSCTLYFHELETIMNQYICQDDYVNIKWCKDVIDIFLNPNYNKYD